MRKNEVLAHSPVVGHPYGQSLKTHSQNTAKLAKSFVPKWMKKEAYFAGLLHDIGKNTAEFQARVRGANTRVPHAFAGGYEAYKCGWTRGAMAIAMHHTGMLDVGSNGSMDSTFMGIMNRGYEKVYDYSGWEYLLPAGYNLSELQNANERAGMSEFFRTKVLFSALADADVLDTTEYASGKKSKASKAKKSKKKAAGKKAAQREIIRREKIDLDKLSKQLHGKIDAWITDNATGINAKRSEILQNCLKLSKSKPGWFTMTVPTGGGKTWSSMAFAVEHAKRNKMDRIIYVIPFCSILGQTQSEFLSVFDPEDMFLHYSTADFNGDEESYKRAETWEDPAVLTTAVQFFESIFSAKKKKLMKLHNMANSVIVIDEAQSIPAKYIIPCLNALDTLVKEYGCTVVLCTATQPAAADILYGTNPNIKMTELCPRREEMYMELKRVMYQYDGFATESKLAEELNSKNRALCIVNTRAGARRIYNMLKNRKNGVYHLSTWMTAKHRQRVISTIKKRLGDPKKRCIVVATNLIEAGIDLDFDEVYREITGLASIIQAGGRCNRNGKRAVEDSIVHIFELEGEHPSFYTLESEAFKKAYLRAVKNGFEIDSIKSIHLYYRYLWNALGTEKQDEKGIMEDVKALRFRTVSNKFHMIENDDCTVYLPLGKNGEALTSRFLAGERGKTFERELGKYAVGIKRKAYEALLQQGLILGDETEIAEAGEDKKHLDRRGVFSKAEIDRYYSKETGFLSP